MHSFRSWKLSKSRLLGAGLVAVATLAGSSAPAQPPLGSAAAGNHPPILQGDVPGAGSVVSADRADFTIQIGETFRIRHERGGVVREILASRPGVVQIDVNPNDASVLTVK